jgi:predicted ester cyclase
MRNSLAIVTATALAACSPAATQPQISEPTMSTRHDNVSRDIASENERLIRRLYDEHINPGRLEGMQEIISDELTGPGGARGAEGFATTMKGLRAGFPDLNYTIEELVADDDSVAVRWTLRGTHTGKFRSFEPTGKKIANNGFAIFRIRDHKLVGASIETDRLGFLISIGAVPYDPAFGPPPAEVK